MSDSCSVRLLVVVATSPAYVLDIAARFLSSDDDGRRGKQAVLLDDLVEGAVHDAENIH